MEEGNPVEAIVEGNPNPNPNEVNPIFSQPTPHTANLPTEVLIVICILAAFVVFLASIFIYCVFCRNQRCDRKSQAEAKCRELIFPPPSASPTPLVLLEMTKNQKRHFNGIFRHDGNDERKMSHGVKHADLKFVLPTINVHQNEIANSRRNSPAGFPTTPSHYAHATTPAATRQWRHHHHSATATTPGASPTATHHRNSATTPSATRHHSAPNSPTPSHARTSPYHGTKTQVPGGRHFAFKEEDDINTEGSSAEEPHAATPTPKDPGSQTNSRRPSSSEDFGLRLEMYTSESDGDGISGPEAEMDERSTSLGKVCFSVQVDLRTREVRVHLKKALRLRSKGSKASINPCIRVTLSPDPKKTKFYSRVHRSPSPELDESFAFSIATMISHRQSSSGLDDLDVDALCTKCEALSPLRELQLRLTLFNCDHFSRKTEAGKLIFKLFDEATPNIDLTHPVFEQGGLEVWRDLKPMEDADGSQENKGQILFSLCRDPAKKTLTIGILKGKDIHYRGGMSSSGDASLVFAKVALLEGGRVLKTKKTTARKKQINPVFNESFSFLVKSSLLDKICIVVSLYSKSVLGHRVLGRTTVGPVMYVMGGGLNHWNDMLGSPKSGVAQWHPIYL